MTQGEKMLTVLTVVAVTVLTRFLSFVLFPLPERAPAFVRYLGRVLPAAVLGFLVVYCLRGIFYHRQLWNSRSCGCYGRHSGVQPSYDAGYSELDSALHAVATVRFQ